VDGSTGKYYFINGGKMEKELIVWCRKMGFLLQNGVPLVKSLEISAEEEKNDGLKDIIEQSTKNIRAGLCFSESMEKASKRFSPAFIGLVRAAENRGELDVAMENIANGLQNGAFKGLREMEENSDELRVTEVTEGELNDTEQWAILNANRLIAQAIKEKASDIHINPSGLEQFHVHFRVNGRLEFRESMEIKKLPFLMARIKHMSALDVGEKRLPQDGRIMIKVDGHRVDLRVATLPGVIGEGITLRILDRTNICLDEELIFPDKADRDIFHKLLSLPYGHIVFSGPTGSGKTTTLYLALSELAKRGGMKIISVEDPVEILLDGVAQVQVNPKLGLTFPAALRTAMRHDPDVISVGEVRDMETIELISRIAQTGHLVFSQLHAKDPIDAIGLLQNSDLESQSMLMAGSVLSAVICQRLMRKICPKCGREAILGHEIAERTGLTPGLKIKEPVGCEECINTGYRGRMPVYEIFVVDRKAKELMINHDFVGLRNYMEQSNNGTMMQKALKYVEEGKTSIEEVLRLFGH
jgi:type II secretory ATPase GspE/PulE/Tfp pilus assembly ATPase PilB-like protein